MPERTTAQIVWRMIWATAFASILLYIFLNL